MAEQDLADRTERATPKRIDEARKRGQVPRSPELGAAAVTLAGGAGLYTLGASMSEGMATMLRKGLSLNPVAQLQDSDMMAALSSAFRDALWSVAPLLGLLMAAALLSPLVIGGWNFSTGAIGFKFERLNPLNGFQRMFSTRGWIELGKSLAKFSVVALIAVLVLWNRADELTSLGAQPIELAIAHAAYLCAEALLALAGGLVLIALVDVPLQLWQYHRDLRMTRNEIREENRDAEGSPEVRSRVRSVQQAIARRRMIQEVPKASVVITNPQHYAVALRYDERRMNAPIVVAKGAGEIARRIREVAAEHKVPLVEAPPLARVLYRSVEIGAEVPTVLYAAVAQVLSYVLQLQTLASRSSVKLQPPVIDAAVENLIPRKGEPV
jgi:flagellar biosynthetic protein FlhB